MVVDVPEMGDHRTGCQPKQEGKNEDGEGGIATIDERSPISTPADCSTDCDPKPASNKMPRSAYFGVQARQTDRV
jgi:hypothetical protein